MKLLFVCMGNICRSPAAENIMLDLLRREHPDGALTVDSAGTIGFHEGKPPDSRMVGAARRRGLRMKGLARPLRAEDLHVHDLILVMDEENHADVLALAGSNPGGKAEIRRFCEFCTEHDETEVPDPYYGGEEGFEKVLDLLEDGCREILRRWRAGNLVPGP